VKTLLLLRHAKAEDGGATVPDFERSLNDRGRKEARLIGTFIRKHELKLNLVLSSSAKRARETTELVLAPGVVDVDVRYDQRIYEASPARLREAISEVENACRTVLVVGHNPGMEELLRLLTDRVEQMATATLAKIDVNTNSWVGVLEGKGTLDWIVKPKELTED
jgi:phosphohistidine phosphatase